MTVPVRPVPARELLCQAVDYMLASADLVTPDLLGRRTPCAGWDLRMLLAHLCESVDALTEGFADGTVCLWPSAVPVPDTWSAALRARCGRLVAAAARRIGAGRPVSIGGHTMPDAMLTCAGAIEVAVHGWDIAAACGAPVPFPEELALPLLAAAPFLVPDEIRAGLFAPPLPPSADADPGVRLLAFLGRPDVPLRQE